MNVSKTLGGGTGGTLQDDGVVSPAEERRDAMEKMKAEK